LLFHVGTTQGERVDSTQGKLNCAVCQLWVLTMSSSFDDDHDDDDAASLFARRKLLVGGSKHQGFTLEDVNLVIEKTNQTRLVAVRGLSSSVSAQLREDLQTNAIPSSRIDGRIRDLKTFFALCISCSVAQWKKTERAIGTAIAKAKMLGGSLRKRSKDQKR